MTYKRNCNYCGKYYEGKGRYYCSKSCFEIDEKEKYDRKKIKKQCLICQKDFRVIFSRRNTAKYCSKKCHSLSKQGKKPPNLEQLLELNRLRSQERKGKTLEELYGEIKAKEILRKMSGENSGSWKDGITPKNKQIWRSEEMKEWRKQVFEIDDYACRKCKEKGGKLHPHHIYNFSSHPELRFVIENGITFCRKCHIKFHKIYGKRNNTKEQVEKFIKIT